MTEEEIDTTECVRCFSGLNWDGDPPDEQSDVLCHDCSWLELMDAREELNMIEKALKDIDLLTCTRSDCKELALKVLSEGDDFRCAFHSVEGMVDISQSPLVRWLDQRAAMKEAL